MNHSSIFARTIPALAGVVSLLTLTVGCQHDPESHSTPPASARVDPKDAKDSLRMASSPAPHPRAQKAARSRHSDEIMVGSPGPHPINTAPTPTPAPGQ